MARAAPPVAADLAQQVRDVLAHLYDPGYLQTHALAGGFGGGRALRGAVVDAVEALKPPRDGKPGPKAIRRHELLRLRYVDGLPAEEVQRELLVGRSEYYREHERAVGAVASLLGERLGAAPAGWQPAAIDAPPAALLAEPTGTLPVYLSSVVGREAESAEVAGLLAGTRLLTLAGAGGCGKTRLAVHVAAGLADGYPAGVRFVDLAPLADPALVPGAVLAALGLREVPGRGPVAAAAAHLQGRAALLVLDNCEHLVGACARLAEELLGACPGLRVLATSQEALGVAGETVWRVPSLPAPAADARPAPAELAAYPAVRLFVDRAAAVAPAFALTDGNAAAVAQVCRRLDGIPLALEMAAARVGVLAVEQIAARLDDALGPGSGRFHLLTGGSRTAPTRQQTLRATIDWSHDLLGEGERTLLRRLAVFAGGWTIEAAEAVCEGEGVEPGAVLDLLTALVAKSLVLAEDRGSGEARYRLFETIRAYGLERLAESGEAAAVRARHAAYCLALVEEAEPDLEGPDGAAWLRRLDREHANLRAALRWFSGADSAEPGLRLANALAMFWYFRGHVGEALGWFDALLARAGASWRTTARARALCWAGWLGRALDEPEEGRRLCHESLELARALNDRRTVGRALVALGVMAVNGLPRDAVAPGPLLEEGLSVGRELRDRWSVGIALLFLGQAAFLQGDHAAARAAFAESVTTSREMGNRWTTAASLELLGNAALAAEDAATAGALFAESLAINREIGDRNGEAHALQGLGLAAHDRGDTRARALLTACLVLQRDLGNMLYLAPTLEGLAVAADESPADGPAPARAVRALRLAGAAQAVRAAHGRPPARREQARLEAGLAPARLSLGTAAAEAAWAEGEAMSPAQAIACALGDEPYA